uniref:Uncharacterized protein n=1 Tax=Arundo donax TaxID=35708 RepID=A0A0A9D5P4_ARUDO
MDMEVPIGQQLQPIMVVQPMVPMVEGGMVMGVVLVVMGVMLAMGQVLALLMVVPCMEVVLMVPTGHMAVPMEVGHMARPEAMVQEDMEVMVELVVWAVAAARVVGDRADTTHMENEHRIIAAF